jgi:ABC-type multidrug transport system fused ATPase/permease subunit
MLSSYLWAGLLGRVAGAVRDGSMKLLLDAVAGALPLLFCVIIIDSVSKYMSEFGCVIAAANIRSDVFKKLLGTPLEKAGDEHSGVKLSYLLNDARIAAEGLDKILRVPMAALFMSIGGMAYIVGIDARIALITVVLAAITFTYSVYFSKRLRVSSDRAQSALAVAGERLKNILDGAVTARIYNMRDMLEERYNEAANEARTAGLRFARDSAILGGINNVQYQLGKRLLVFAAGILLLDGALDLPALVSVSQMAGSVVGVFHVSRILPDVRKTLAGARRIFKLLDTEESVREGNEEIDPESGHNAIEFVNVSFGYNEKALIIENLSFSVNAGELAVIVGESGSGKSTLLRLMQGLLEPSGGKIKIFGTDICDAAAHSLRRNISVVPQDVVLFPGTIADNIGIGCGDASGREIVRAAVDANAHGFIMEMENGYDTLVSERGLSISGGQRQRIAMARAFLRNTPIILLDEATSALDAQNEELLKQSLLSRKGRQTIVVVTHSRSVAEIADRVIYVD